VADGRFDGLAVCAPHGVQVGQAIQRFEGAVGVDAVCALQLPGEITLQQSAALDDSIVDVAA